MLQPLIKEKHGIPLCVCVRERERESTRVRVCMSAASLKVGSSQHIMLNTTTFGRGEPWGKGAPKLIFSICVYNLYVRAHAV